MEIYTKEPYLIELAHKEDDRYIITLRRDAFYITRTMTGTELLLTLTATSHEMLTKVLREGRPIH